ncbi:hypothetical protein SFRURICE_008500 [Spodoptera frugiperda]|nr:hypothetical protein SFRURICE_008500 [Spodoptera frugiperda]
MTCNWGHLYFTILFYIIIIQSLNCSSVSKSTNPNQYVVEPLYLPDDLTDEIYDGLLRQRPDLEPVLSAQRKTQIERRQNKEGNFLDEEQEILLVENEDNDITRPLREFEDGRTTMEVNPLLVPEFTKNEKQRLPFIVNKKQRFNDTTGLYSNDWDRAWDNAWWAANCYTCYAEDESVENSKTPRQNLCHTAFQSNDWRYVTSQKYFKSGCYYSWEYRKRGYWKYKRYFWRGGYKGTYGATLHRLGSYAKGCMKRFSDVSEMFTMRACRGWWPMYVGGLMENRMVKLEFPITKDINNTCRTSKHATLTPFQRGVSLYGRFHACTCVGRYCNNTVVNGIYVPLLVITVISLSTSPRHDLDNMQRCGNLTPYVDVTCKFTLT